MSVSSEERFAPPQAVVADVVAPDSGEVLAGRGIRLVSALVDGGVLWALSWLVMKAVPVLGELVAANEKNATFLSWNLTATAIGIVLFAIVQVWPLVKRQQTVGKMIFKLRIVRSDGSKPDAWRLLGLRYGIGYLMVMNVATALVYSLIDCLLIFRESRKCLHDTIADTKVIKL
jgi:uncharacterized RDD family membrane protein YckC